MVQAQQVEELVCLVARMDRAAIARQLQAFEGGFPIDFTPHFIETTDLERLRHIFLALCLQTRQMPEIDEDDGPAVICDHAA